MERRSKAARKTVESLCCKCRKRTKAGIHSPALLLSLLYKLVRKKYSKKKIKIKRGPEKSAYYQGCREKVV